MSNAFQYVVVKVKPDPICFGSKVIRDTNPIGKGISAFQRRYANENYPNITPQTYHIKSGLEELRQKVGSKKGVGGLANETPRFPRKVQKQTGSPTKGKGSKSKRRKVKKRRTKVPFGSKEPRSVAVSSPTPGPGYYDVKFPRCARTKMAANFGRPKMVPAVEEKCMAAPTDKCDICGVLCENDYWHKNNTEYLCHMCMEEEKIMHENNFTLKELKTFQKIRTCSIRHIHEGVPTAVSLLPKPKMDKRERLENYLNLFISSF